MSWGTGVRITAKELLAPILQRIGMANNSYFLRFIGALDGIAVVERGLASFSSIIGIGRRIITTAKSNPIFGQAWAYLLGVLMAKTEEIWQTVENQAGAIWDKSGGEIGDYLIETGALFVTEYIREASLRKTGVALNLHLSLPMDDAKIEIIGEDIGTWLALLANSKVGTNFTSLYPPENLKAEIQNQVVAELTTGGRVLLSEANVQAIITGLQQVRDTQLVQQYGLLKSQGLAIPPELQTETKAARRRAQNREAQRNYRATHHRTYTPWVHN